MNQTRPRKRKSVEVSAPTGQMSTTLPAYVRVERLAGEGRDEALVAALRDAELRLLRDLAHEADAARAEDAALLVEHHQRARARRACSFMTFGTSRRDGCRSYFM